MWWRRSPETRRRRDAMSADRLAMIIVLTAIVAAVVQVVAGRTATAVLAGAAFGLCLALGLARDLWGDGTW